MRLSDSDNRNTVTKCRGIESNSIPSMVGFYSEISLVALVFHKLEIRGYKRLLVRQTFREKTANIIGFWEIHKI